MKHVKILFILMLSAIMALAAGCGGSNSADKNSTPNGGKYPQKPITMIVTHAANGDTDHNARLLARIMSKELGQPVVVENVTGNNGATAMEQYRNGANDGYTIIATNSAALIGNEATGLSSFTYTDFEPVAIYGRQAGENIFVRSDAPYNTIKSLIEASKSAPNSIRYGISTGGGVYMASVIMDKSLGAQFNIVDAGDAANRLEAILDGHIDATSLPYSIAREYISNGKLKTLGTLLSKRSELLNEIPSVSETYPDLSVDTLYVVLAPKGTDPEIVEKLNKTIRKIVRTNPEYMAECEKYNFQAPWSLDIENTNKELAAQREHFMTFSQYLKGSK